MCAMYDIVSIHVQMRARRLLCLSRLYQTAPKELLVMLAELAELDNPNFASQVLSDLHELVQCMPYLDHLGPLKDNQKAWYKFVSADPVCFANIVDRCIDFSA